MPALEAAITKLAQQNANRKDWDVPLDYFSWGRDPRHRVDNTETLPENPLQAANSEEGQGAVATRVPMRRKVRHFMRRFRPGYEVKKLTQRFCQEFEAFEETYSLMSDDASRDLFAELIYMKLVSEKRARLSSFDQRFIDSYEEASSQITASERELGVHSWILKEIELERPQLSFYTVPTILNLHLTRRLYRYEHGPVRIEVQPGDVVLDAGVGWGDTCVYLASLASAAPGGHTCTPLTSSRKVWKRSRSKSRSTPDSTT